MAMFSTLWKAWGLELWALAGAIASFVAMMVLLATYDGKNVVNWNGITLNAIVSLLSVITKTTLAYIISECMAQWKWIMFAREERPLMDFDRIDAAARGPLGSLRILTRTRRAPSLYVGAFLTLLVLGLDPFAQQLIQFNQDVHFAPEKSTGSSSDPSNTALISRAPSYTLGKVRTSSQSVNGTNLDLYTVKAQPPLSMQLAILNGFSRTPWEVAQEPLVQCPTGNCTWAPFDTLAVCDRCNDVTSDLRQVDDFGDALLALNDQRYDSYTVPSTAFALPNGHFIANVDGCPTLNGPNADCDNDQHLGIYSDQKYAVTAFGTGNPNKTSTMKDIDTLIWSTSLIYPDVQAVNRSDPQIGNDRSPSPVKWPKVPLRATECAVYYCVKTVRSEMQGNKLSEAIEERRDARRDPDSWRRRRERPDAAPENIPPNDVADSLEFDSRYSAADYSDLSFKIPGESESVGSTTFTVSQESIKSISSHFQTLFKGNFTSPRLTKALDDKLGKGAVGINGFEYGPEDDSLDMQASPEMLSGLWTWTQPNMTSTFASLAISMTNEMRRKYDASSSSSATSGQDPNRHQDGTMSFYGSVGTTVVMYRIQWGWIALHAAMLALGLGFFCHTVITASRPQSGPLWKSSSLGTIRRGREVGDVLDGADTLDGMDLAARKVRVQTPWREEITPLTPLNPTNKT